MNKGFVALSIFEVSNGMINEVQEAFVNRPHFVENAEGFVKLEVLSPFENKNEIWLITYWENENCYKNWFKSENHKKSHDFMPKGLKLNPEKTSLLKFNFISK